MNATTMGFEYKIRMVCDRCGFEIEPWTEVKSVEAIKWDAKRKWKIKHEKTGVMLGLPNRYGKYSIFCQPCADGSRTLLNPLPTHDDSQAK